jgi:hypothetical protein
MELRILIIILLLFLLNSCCTNSDDSLMIIDTHTSKSLPTNLSEVFDKNEIVKLETKNSFLIERIDNVDVFKDFILVNEVSGMERSLLKFSNSGSYITQIGYRGHRPGEYFSFSGKTMDTIKQRIVMAPGEQYLLFNFEGNSIHSFPNNNAIREFMALVVGQLWISVLRPMIKDDKGGFKEEHLLYRLDDEFADTDSILTQQVFLKRKILASAGRAEYISSIKSGTYYYCPIAPVEPVLRDTLYKLEGSKLIPAIQFDFSEILSVGEDTYVNADIRKYFEKYKDKIRNITIRSIHGTERYLFAEYYYDQKIFVFCYDLKNKKGYNMQYGFTDDLFGTEKPVELIPLDLQKGEFCFVKNGYELEGLVDEMNETSNPVIFFIKAKV